MSDAPLLNRFDDQRFLDEVAACYREISAVRAKLAQDHLMPRHRGYAG